MAYDIAATIDKAISVASVSISDSVGRTQVVASSIMGLMVFLEVCGIFLAKLLGSKSVAGVLSSEDWKKRFFNYLMWSGTFVLFPILMPVVRKVLVWTGVVLAGQRVSDEIIGPGAFIAQCLLTVKPLWESAFADGQSFLNVMVNLVSLVFVFGAYIQLVLIYVANTLSFGVVVALGLYFIPLGVFSITEQFSEYYIQCLISYGIRFIITIFMVEMTFGIFADSLKQFDLTKIEDCCAVVVLVLAYNVAVNVVPNTAKDIASGSVSSYRASSLVSNVASEMAFSAVMGKLMAATRGGK